MQGRRAGQSRSELSQQVGDMILYILSIYRSFSSVSLTAILRYQIYLCSALSMLYACRLTIAAAIVLAHPMFLWVQCICDPLRHGSQHILYAQTRLIPSLGWQDIFILATIMYASTSKSEYFVTLLSANV